VKVSEFARAPKVSVAIINWNYGRFVGEAIQSVKAQTYKNLECIVLDNGSTDDSVDVISQAIDGHPQFTFERLPENLGHLGAGLWLLDRLKGDFVTFLDADDVLLPDYVASHVQAHLGAGLSTGFSSSNCRDIDADGVIQTSGHSIMHDRWPEAQRCFTSKSEIFRIAELDDEGFTTLAKATRFLPTGAKNWGWVQGSANMYRRVLLERLRPKAVGPKVFGGIDGYFTPLLHAMTGALLINRPLSLYRVHNANDYSALPSLNSLRIGTAAGEVQGDEVLLLALQFLIAEMAKVLQFLPAARFLDVLEVVSSTSRHDRPFAQPAVKKLITSHYRRLAETFGSGRILVRLRDHLKTKDCIAILRESNNGRLQFSDLRDLTAAEIRRYRRKRRRQKLALATLMRHDRKGV
jgi:glycosyltransferase involved in cell wall biosynthesis